MTSKPFEFTDKEILTSAGVFVAKLPAGLTSKRELLDALYQQLELPGYFGFNWDALSDCLRDFHWLDAPTVVLAHADLPALLSDEQRIYLTILAESVDSWRDDIAREFRVTFPTDCAAQIRDA